MGQEKIQAKQESAEKTKRPGGITFWAVLNLIGGAILLITLLFFGNRLVDGLGELGLSGASFYLSQITFIVLSLGGGFGMLTGKKYGWYLGTFLYFFDIMRRLNATFAVFQAASIYGEAVWNSSRVSMSIIGDIGGVVVDLFIIGYFFRDYVLTYFKLDGILKWRTVGIFCGAAVLIYAISSLLNALA